MELVKECCPVEGTWKPVSINGGVEMCAALGNLFTCPIRITLLDPDLKNSFL